MGEQGLEPLAGGGTNPSDAVALDMSPPSVAYECLLASILRAASKQNIIEVAALASAQKVPYVLYERWRWIAHASIHQGKQ